VDAVKISDNLDTNIKDLFTVVGPKIEESDKINSAPYSYWKMTFKQLVKNPIVILCLGVLALLLFFILFVTSINYHPTMVLNSDGNFVQGEIWGSGGHYFGPNASNWFGVCGDNMKIPFAGLDLWSCVWEGAQLSLLLGVTVAVIDTILGILIGSLWGYFRWLDPILIEFRNFVNNIPTILLDILLMQILAVHMKKWGFLIIVMLLCALGWLGLAGFIRNQIIIIRNREYNIASTALGSSPAAMIQHNLLPYLISVIVTVVSISVPQAISAEVGLAFFNLSFKISDGSMTLGQVLTQSVQGNQWMAEPYLLFAPLIVMAPLTVCFFYLGMALADATDPKTHR
jgi:oligopeptide transport system permease protein